MYTTTNDGDNIPSCRTPLEIVKYGDISALHIIHRMLIFWNTKQELSIRI